MEIKTDFLKEFFVKSFIEEGFTELEAIKSSEVIMKTYSDYLSKYSLPGVGPHKMSIEEIKEIREIALKRLEILDRRK
jgi:hypothetical protein